MEGGSWNLTPVKQVWMASRAHMEITMKRRRSVSDPRLLAVIQAMTDTCLHSYVCYIAFLLDQRTASCRYSQANLTLHHSVRLSVK